MGIITKAGSVLNNLLIMTNNLHRRNFYCTPHGRNLRGFIIYNKSGDSKPSNMALAVL